MFINYTPQTGVTISRSRHPSAYYGEISDVAMAVTYNHESCYCDMDGAKAALEALRDAVREATNNPDPSDPVLRSRTAPDA